MADRVAVHGFAARRGQPSFALAVLRFARPVDRAVVTAALRHLAPLVAGADDVIEEFAELPDEAVALVAIPWLPPASGEVAAQRALIEGAAVHGVEAIWCFQTGTRLPLVEEGAGEDADDDDEDDEDERSGAAWSHGPPPQRTDVPFPVDGHPAILENLDWEDFGIAVKLAGAYAPGERAVLDAFHALWLAPYGGRFRHADVTIDARRNAAHFWVDRFAVPSSPGEQVGHLLWVIAQLHEVLPIVHARFGGATMEQKYGELVGDEAEVFVLGGNPLLAVYARDGEEGVDRWIAEQTSWSTDELAQMLREVAIEIVASGEEEAGAGDDGDEDDEDDDEDGDDRDGGGDDGDEDDGDDDDDEDSDDDDDDDDGDPDGDPDEDRGRHIASYAGELLTARARAGALDKRAADALRPALAVSDPYEHRRTAVVGVLGALRDRASVPALLQILDENTIEGALDSIEKEDCLAETAAALGHIADPAAIPALSKLVAAVEPHSDKPRPFAAEALAACLAAAPAPRDVGDAVVDALLHVITERNDGELAAELHIAYGRIAQQLPQARREVLRRRLEETEPASDDESAKLARRVALVLANGGALDDATALALRHQLHAGLTALDYNHEYTVRNLRVALRAAESMTTLVDPADLVWLTRFAEPDVRERAHALLAKLRRPLPRARSFDARAARALDDDTLVELLAETHIVGRAALVGEVARRDLASGRAAVRRAVRDVMDRARSGGANLLDPDTRLLEHAVPWLLGGALDDDTIALFDRMLRHSNHHVKWELLQEPPDDERLLGGMFHVLAERWGWQENTARAWLRQFEGSDAYEVARRRVDASGASDDEAN